MNTIKKWRTRLSLVLLTCLWTFAMYSDKKNEPVYSNTIMKRHLIVISIDALSSNDFEQIAKLSNFKKLIDNGSIVREVTGVYPSLTYPSHTTIVTGVYPYKHGIINNKLKQIGVKEQDWYWYSKDVKVPTLYGAAKNKNMEVAALGWPVTAGADIKYNIPEIWSNEAQEDQFDLFRKYGTAPLVNMMKEKYGKSVIGRKQPELDNFIADSAAFIIKQKRPGLMLIHLSELDSKKHAYGIHNEKVLEAFKRQNERLGKIINAVKKAGIESSTTFVITGDHGFSNINNKINVNSELRRQGLIKVDNNSNVLDWKAYVNACDGSAYVYIKDKDDVETKKKVTTILNDLLMSNYSGVERVFNNSDICKLGADRNAEFMLEAKEGYYFSNDWQGDNLIEVSKASGTHGYLPTKAALQTMFIASGSGVKKGINLRSMNMVDEAPTLAKLLGVELNDVDGYALNQILK
ncbi:alkaline phosphatase family protein [Clostridium omnivorum]|uniref:Alkaline phosphatase family protein n=1 Tax=Clostridium omnivorum TaxID=1604902 RepID=A0ABQ5N0P4_9CLOT|nr:ectonucleotide pyrophosphatase/phosphodiesterase [Clostridium sp. E14]GLC28762.1 alkaline phosphatase family protein [Clostridium sp. E14]